MEEDYICEVNKKSIIIVTGPTAVGKTALGIELAENFDTVILSADSRQFYRQMNIGTAKPVAEELEAVKHYFINNLDIDQGYNAGAFEKDALILLDKLFEKKEVVIVVGGSGLYLKALCEGMDEMPFTDQDLRKKLNEEKENSGLDILVERLKSRDPEYAAIADLKNPQRVVRALEVIELSGNTYTSFRNREESSGTKRPFEIIKVGLELPRETLYERINNRMDLMIGAGLFEEAKELYPNRDLNALQTVGYTEVFNFLAGEYDKEEAIRLLKRNSRRYAKRQLTWFKKDKAIRWFNPDRFDDIISYVNKALDI